MKKSQTLWSLACFFVSYVRLIGLFSLLVSISAKDRLVFEAQYNVAWKGWSCGSMYSQLWQHDDLSYYYSQTLKSALFFYPFIQKEESHFQLKNGEIVCQRYEIYKEGMDGPCYTVLFHDRYMEVSVSGKDDLFHYAMENEAVHDKLVTQLVLIRKILDNSNPGDRTVLFVDPEGVHYRTYSLHIQDEELIFKSDYRYKTSTFTLDPSRRYLPVLFEQYRHGALFLTGKMVNAKFGSAWDDFLES